MIFKAFNCHSKKLYSSEPLTIFFNKNTTISILKDKPDTCTICKRVRQELLTQNRESELTQFDEFMKNYNKENWKITVW